MTEKLWIKMDSNWEMNFLTEGLQNDSYTDLIQSGYIQLTK